MILLYNIWGVGFGDIKMRFLLFNWNIIFVILSLGFLICTPLRASDVEKVLYLIIENNEIVASNTLSGRFERLKLGAKEKIVEHKVADAVAVVETSQRYSAYGVLSGGWKSIKLRAQENTVSIQVEDFSANVVTSDRILNFNGRNGVWKETRRSIQ